MPVRLADADAAWTRAALAWSSATPAAFSPVEGASPSAPDPLDGVTSAHDVASAEAWRALVGDDSVVAFTLLTIDEAGSCTDACLLKDADVLVNSATWRFSTSGARDAFDREAVLAHELGHVLGLGHACVELDAPEACIALMAPVVTPGPSQRRAPAEDDITGATAWLPSGDVVRVAHDAVDARTFTGVARWRAWYDGVPGVWARGGGLGPTRLSAVDAELVEAWSVTGHGAALALEAPPKPVDAGTSPKPDMLSVEPRPRSDAGCQVQRDPVSGVDATLPLTLLLLCRRSRRSFR